MTKFKTAGPVLASLDIPVSVQFYEDKLGFRRTFCDEGYGIVIRDHIPIHFWHCDDEIFPKNTSCYIYLESGVDELFEEYEPHDVIHPNSKLENHPWGMREFAILDNFGNLIRFGQEI